MSHALLQEQNIHQFPPWHLQGEGFILNYWLTPGFIQQAKQFRIAPSPLGRVVQVLLVRYHSSPIGPYDELLILDHPLISKRRLSSIPKIYVSTHESVIHGQHLWGIPKEHAEFEWQEKNQEILCHIQYQNQRMTIRLKKTKSARKFYINSHHIPASMLKIQQAWKGQRFQFSPQFRGHLSKLSQVEWQDIDNIFPDFSKAKLLQSFYVPKFNLIFPEAQISSKV
ncbi:MULTISPECIES: acetoacetate decarboxylase family protein [Acinetobacter]|uniref:acetoacetate decarboxylase family protein n=1 Tax=Acinetobacter TaxID=469 RepID=UPI000C236C1E|nr:MULTISPECIES: acetoacetate decarboxylase family protein [Acinetobacter]MDH5820477.1 acetoacetate decarboxylase family protein [Acinetobacter pseudolwoffii]PJI33705.1 hypothetical protein CU318_13525 [Acinetobacter pseudolwoffii]